MVGLTGRSKVQAFGGFGGNPAFGHVNLDWLPPAILGDDHGQRRRPCSVRDFSLTFPLQGIRVRFAWDATSSLVSLSQWRETGPRVCQDKMMYGRTDRVLKGASLWVLRRQPGFWSLQPGSVSPHCAGGDHFRSSFKIIALSGYPLC